MSTALAYTLMLIRQRMAPDAHQQYRFHELFVAFTAGQLTAEQYEQKLYSRRPGDRRKAA